MERQHASSLAERLRRNNRVDLPECPTADQLPNNRKMAHSCQNVPPQISCPITGKWPTTTFTAANMNTPQTCPLTIVTSPGDFILAAGLLLLGFAFSFKSRRRLQLFAGLAFSCVLLFGATGCGSGGNSQWNPITPKATYHVTVTGVSGIITHSKQLTEIG